MMKRINEKNQLKIDSLNKLKKEKNKIRLRLLFDD